MPVQRLETAEHHRDSSVESDDREIGVAFCREFFWNQNSAYFHIIIALKYIGEPPVWENMHNHNKETDSTVSYIPYTCIF